MAEKELLYIDMDGVLADFYGAVKKEYPDFDHYERGHQREITNALSSTEGFFIDLEPLPDAVKAFKKLSEAYEVYILSTPLWEAPYSWAEKRIWVEEKLGTEAYKKLILSHNKGLFSGKALIDDRIRNGVEHFHGEHIHFGTEDFPDWTTVINYLLS